jgi:hypothetical protein
VKPATVDYLAKAEECPGAARKVIAIQLPAVAAKEAYLAAYHAAQALVFQATGKAAKTHSGMRTLFARVAKDDPSPGSTRSGAASAPSKATQPRRTISARPEPPPGTQLPCAA